MIKIVSLIDRLNERLGKLISWLTLVLVAIIILDVFFRYAFSVTSSASFEIEWHLFAAIFLLSAGWALQEDRHVRVDVFYQKFSERKKAWVNLGGTMLLLMPLCIVGFLEGLQFTKNAYLLNETSPDPGGLPHRFIIKGTIPLGFLLLALQGLSIILRNIMALTKTDNQA